MFFRWRVLLCAFVLLSILDVKPVVGRKGYSGGHSYPRSGGLSGGGRHSYPSSGGLSGGGHGNPPSSNHGYPSSGGLSGGSRGYPSSGGSPGYPSSGGNHGYPSSVGAHGYPSSSGGLSGNSHGYPSNKYPSGSTHTTNIHNHYHYTPPQQIRYAPVSGGAPVNYPVYRGTPPTYVYQIKDSGSKYGTLLTGLALLNLGALAGTAYAVSHSHSGSGGSGSGQYKPQPGEVCMFGVKKDNGDYEETRINCQLITSFIYQEEAKANNATNTTIVTTMTNVTTINMTNGVPEAATTTQPPGDILYKLLPNGTLVPVNVTTAVNNTNPSGHESPPNNTMTSSVTVTTTTTNTTVTNALDVKGKPIDVTPGMQCFVMRTTPTSRLKKSVPCGLLQTYAEKSIKKNAAGRNVPAFTLLAVVVALCLT